MNDRGKKGYLLIILAGFLWGTIGVFANFLEDMGVAPLPLAFFRLLSGTVLLVPMMLIIGKGWSLFKISRRGLLSCILVGVLSQGLYNMCYMYAIQLAGMSTAAVLLYTSPVFVAIMSLIFFREPLTKRKLAAIALNILGCIMTVTGGDFTQLKIAGFGILMGIGAGFTYALMPVFSRIGADQENPLTSAFYGLGFGALALFFMNRPWNGAGLSLSFTLPMIILIVGYGLIPTAFGYIVYFSGLGKVKETSIVPILTSIETVTAAVIGVMAFHDAFSPGKAVGILFVVGSIVVMNLRLPQRAVA
ncbi:MAG: DMT family transporter [Eubacterium sp.]